MKSGLGITVGYPVRFGKHLGIFTNFVAQRIGKLFGVIEYLDLLD